MTKAARQTDAPRRTNSAGVKRRWEQAAFNERRELIVEVALALLKKHGYKAVTVRRVAEKLGVGAMTLYTYFDGRDDLRLEMVKHGFDLMRAHCDRHSTIDTDDPWIGGARAYLDFAVSNPKLYELMFSLPRQISSMDADDGELYSVSFQPLVEKVKDRLITTGRRRSPGLDRDAKRLAGTYWMALHGIASLAIAGRLTVLEDSLDDLLRQIVDRNAPCD